MLMQAAVHARLATLALLSSCASWAAAPDAASMVAKSAVGRLIGGAPFASSRGAGFAEGPILEVDVGAALPVRVGQQEAMVGVAFGGTLGYQFANGLTPFVAYHLLGTSESLIDDSDLKALVVGARYSLPFFAPSPFVEVMAGPVFVSQQTLVGPVDALRAGGAIGLGCSIQLGRYFALGLVGRYWLVDGPRGLLQVVGAEAFASANFGILFRKGG